jgi:CBS domain-containing protein
MGGHSHHHRAGRSRDPGRLISARRRGASVLAKNLMEAKPITISPEATLLSVHHLFVEEEIHGAPVVDENDGRVVGVVSTLDLLRAVQETYESGATTSTYFREDLPYSGPDWLRDPDDFQDRLRELNVQDVMARDLVTVSERATAAEIAGIMRAQRVHRVLVVDDGQLRGLVSTFDLLGLIENRL